MTNYDYYDEDYDDLDFDEGRYIHSHHDHCGRGYVGHSWSVNAELAREDGECPMGEWTKKAFGKAISSISPEKAKLVAKIDVSVLRIYFLKRTASHHTSAWYNKTPFYALNVKALEKATEADLIGLSELRPPKVGSVTMQGTFKYIEWQKPSAKWHPGRFSSPCRAIHHELPAATITVKGQFFSVTTKDGLVLRKKVGSTGTEVVLASGTPYPPNVCAFLEMEPQSEDFTPDPSRFDVSRRGQIYLKGRKPSPDDFDNGIGNFFKVGERRVGKNEFGCYQLEEWNGGWWLPVRE